MSSLKETWIQCMQGHAAILQAYVATKRDSMDYFKQDQFVEHENIYQTMLDYMTECLEELEPSVSLNRSIDHSVNHTDCSSFSLKHLPAIQMPPFSGKIEDWENFRDRFQSLIIDNNKISDFARMHFLSSSLTGRAHDVIACILITADNFQIAWQALIARYENKRRLIEAHVSALYNLQTLTRESTTELHALRDKADKAISALKRLKRSPAEILSDILVYFVSQKLDAATRRAWKLKFNDDSPPPSYEDLSRFISSWAIALEELNPTTHNKLLRKNKVTSSTVSPDIKPNCPLRKKLHYINKCTKFVDKNPSQRREIVQQRKWYLNCLSGKHAVENCPNKFTCRTCQNKHHSMLHVDSDSASKTPIASVNTAQQSTFSDDERVVSLSSIALKHSPTPVLLATATITVRSASGCSVKIRALLDQGSEVTFITENLAQMLHLNRTRTVTRISAVGGTNAGIRKHTARLVISSRDNTSPSFSVLAFIMKSLIKYTPRRRGIDIEWKHLQDLHLADDDPTGSNPIDIIIGTDLYGRIILDGVRKGFDGQPIAQNSHFGWILFGPMSDGTHSTHSFLVHHCSLEYKLYRFWEIEEFPRVKTLTQEEKRCEDHFKSTHSRAENGRYLVRLPFRHAPPLVLGDSRALAAKLLAKLNHRFKVNHTLKDEYCNFLTEYEQLGHMRHVAAPQTPNSQFVYILHHPVIKDSSSTTRLRVVFNASYTTTNGLSLNHYLLPGPKLQTNLLEILLRWRQHKYVYAADITKMYRQILIDPRDRDYQRILWNSADSMEVQEYQLLTVTYGTLSAPFLALRVLQQLAHDEGASFPSATVFLRDNIYVDDILFGAEDIPLLRHMRHELCSLLHPGGGIRVAEWASNKTKLLADISPNNHDLACNRLLPLDENLKVLGVGWTPALDVFQFHVSLPESIPHTKRIFCL